MGPGPPWQAQLLQHRHELQEFLSQWLNDDRSMCQHALNDEKARASCMSLTTSHEHPHDRAAHLLRPSHGIPPSGLPAYESAQSSNFDGESLPRPSGAPSVRDSSAVSLNPALEDCPDDCCEDLSGGILSPPGRKTPKHTNVTFTSNLSVTTEKVVEEDENMEPAPSSPVNRMQRSFAARQMREEFKAFMMASDDSASTDWKGPALAVQLATSQWFVNLGMMAIVTNAVYMIWGESIPLGDLSDHRQDIFVGDVVFLLFFGFELAVHWVARGLCRFFTANGWQLRLVELLVVIEQIFSLVVQTAHTDFVRATRLLRAARFSRILRVARFVRLLQLLLASSQYRLMAKSLEIMPQPSAIIGCVLYLTVQVFALMITMQVRAFLEESPAEHAFLLQHFGSVLPSVSSLWSAMTLGTSWDELAEELLQVGWVCFASFQLYVFIFTFIITNLIRALFIQNTMQTMNIAKTFDIRTLMNRKHVFVSDFMEAFGRETLEYDDVSGHLEAMGKVRMSSESPEQLALSRFSKVTQLATTELDNIMYCLSDAGTQMVPIDEFVTSCIGQMDAATKADLQSVSMRQMQLQTAFRKAKMAEGAVKGMHRPLDSLSTTAVLQELHIIATTEEQLAEEVVTLYDSRFPFDDGGIQTFLKTLRGTIEAAKQAKGGSGFIVGTAAAYKKLKQRRIRMEPSDVSHEYRKGYMTTRLRHRHVGEDIFLQAIRDFSDHSLEKGDRWPDDHEAAGLPKDGYMLLSQSGVLKMGAAKLSGCPKSSCVWRGVGTRHQTGLSVCEVLAGELAAVVIVSDSKRITVLCPFGTPLGVQTGTSQKPGLLHGSTGSSLAGLLHGWSSSSGWFSLDSEPKVDSETETDV